ncbi:uncharacterized protein LOC143865926 [Tasmannia lanceolata]|uniref:uncharacterized protein LOC143865926 n=1 Tax=Tasmannia lanceolata TaxID=3420 RepID=UPI004062CA0A
MASSFCFALHAHGLVKKPSTQPHSHHLTTLLSSTQPLLKELQKLPMRIDVSTALISTALKKTSARILDAFVDSVFQFSDQELLPSQSNFRPVEEIGEAVTVQCVEGEIPIDFPEGVYIRNAQKLGSKLASNIIVGMHLGTPPKPPRYDMAALLALHHYLQVRKNSPTSCLQTLHDKLSSL